MAVKEAEVAAGFPCPEAGGKECPKHADLLCLLRDPACQGATCAWCDLRKREVRIRFVKGQG